MSEESEVLALPVAVSSWLVWAVDERTGLELPWVFPHTGTGIRWEHRVLVCMGCCRSGGSRAAVKAVPTGQLGSAALRAPSASRQEEEGAGEASHSQTWLCSGQRIPARWGCDVCGSRAATPQRCRHCCKGRWCCSSHTAVLLGWNQGNGLTETLVACSTKI